MTELQPLDEVAALAADLRTWLEVHRDLEAGAPDAPLPSCSLPSEEPAVVVPVAPPVRRPEPRPAPPPPVAQPTPTPAADPPVAAGPRLQTLETVRAELGDCARCKLARGRSNIVYGVGSASAKVVFVGEGPGYHEDRLGEPFVGKAGALLDRIIENVLRLSRGEVYICNVVKCRPPQNRDPRPDEVEACSPFLRKQLEVIDPAVVVGLGRFAVQTLLKTTTPIGRLRGRAHPFGDAALVPTYHPAYLLRNPDDKRKTLADMMLVRSEIEKRTGSPLPPVLTSSQVRRS